MSVTNTKIKMVLFDLDGTLLPMEQETFTKAYFKSLAEKLVPLGLEPQELIQAIWTGIGAMVRNDNSKLNEEVFWSSFQACFVGKQVPERTMLEDYYRVEFQKVADVCGFHPAARQTLELLRDRGYRTVLATNPIFPAIATESRVRWAGLDPSMFELITTYENSGYCKPNPQYYADILEKMGCTAEECLMVGNDVEEDMIARTLGMQVFLLTDCLINKKNVDISVYPHGGFEELNKLINSLNQE